MTNTETPAEAAAMDRVAERAAVVRAGRDRTRREQAALGYDPNRTR